MTKTVEILPVDESFFLTFSLVTAVRKMINILMNFYTDFIESFRHKYDPF